MISCQPGFSSLQTSSSWISEVLGESWGSYLRLMVQKSGINSPVEVGSLSHDLQDFRHPRWWSPDFWTINSTTPERDLKTHVYPPWKWTIKCRPLISRTHFFQKEMNHLNPTVYFSRDIPSRARAYPLSKALLKMFFLLARWDMLFPCMVLVFGGYLCKLHWMNSKLDLLSPNLESDSPITQS